jgi:YD repeat-containing protein
MLKRFFTLALLSSLLLAIAAVPPNVKASGPGGPNATKKGVTFDQSGRPAKATVTNVDGEEVEYGFRFDAQNRLSHVVLGDGAVLGLVYGKDGQWLGITCPDGGRMMFIHDNAGKVIGFKRELITARREGGSEVLFVKAAAQDPDRCRAAVMAAAGAAANAAATCAVGEPISCVTATAVAAAAAYAAYLACRPAPDESGPVVVMGEA